MKNEKWLRGRLARGLCAASVSFLKKSRVNPCLKNQSVPKKINLWMIKRL